MVRLRNVIFCALFLQNVMSLIRIDPLVDTNVGLIKGLRADDGGYSMFMGIPYAKVDADRPFADAIPYPPFDDTLEAYDDSVVCPQLLALNNTIAGNIDCLHLNVFVPLSATFSTPAPVMVYVHGGYFNSGFGGRQRLSPKFLVRQDVIVVTINYRLGVYGFMCLDTPEASGNQGLKDQLIALKWIKDNIQAFGGDADKITLFGESAGGHSIDLHLRSAKEKLYNQVILESGSSEAATVLYEPDKNAAVKLADFLGFETTDTNEALSFLSKVDSNLLVAAGIELNIEFKPCVETQFDEVEPFFTTHWINLDAPNVVNMPVMIGFNEHELGAIHIDKDPEYYENLDLVSEYLRRVFDFDEETFKEMKDLVSHNYFADETISQDQQWAIMRFDSDFTYVHPIQRTIKKYMENNAGNIYQYMFSYIGGRNNLVTTVKYGPFEAACCASHADELPYLFDVETKPEMTPTDEILMEKITTLWTNFAKYGDPTPQTSELLPVKWLPVTKDNSYYMNINVELKLQSRPNKGQMSFWNLFYKYNKKSQRFYEEL